MTTPNQQQQQQQPAAPVPGTPEYDAAMAAKFEATQNQGGAPAAAGQRPEWLPEKFKSPEDMAKAYAELEKKVGAPAPQGEAEAAANKALEGTGLNVQDFAAEFAEKGELGQESYDKLAKAGISKETVDAFIAGQQALADQRTAKGMTLVGGEDNFKAMSAWASTNLTADELKAYNAGVSGSEAQMQMTLLGLKARYEAANGSAPNLLGGGNGHIDTGYQSMAQVTQAMKDPRYAKDPAYRAEVERKLARTTGIW